MNRASRSLGLFGLLAALVVGMTGVARAEDLSEPVLLVASSALDGSPFEQTVVLAAPLPSGGHIGFILNRPTTAKLGTLFPNDEAAQKVTEPVYLGGPTLVQGVFAVTRNPPIPSGTVVPLMPGLVAVLDAPTVDRILATAPNDARYYAGLMLWEGDELEQEVSRNAWEVRPADPDTVLRAKSRGLWNSLRGPMATLQLPHAARIG
jgi:putative AlgH/UPF0301 family transcriptional regulator